MGTKGQGTHILWSTVTQISKLKLFALFFFLKKQLRKFKPNFMAAMSIYCKKNIIFFSETERLMTLNIGMQHYGLGSYQVCLNEVPWLTLICFTSRSSSVTEAFVWKKGLTLDNSILLWPATSRLIYANS